MRSILKRPAALPLSPSAQWVSFSHVSSPSSQKPLKSPVPHVRFPASPTKLVATVNTYAPDAYDRVPILVSPNPLAMPGWGERVYSPSEDRFRLSVVPKVFRSLSMAPQPSPAVPGFEDPRSPRLQPAADVTGSKAVNSIRSVRMEAMQGLSPAEIKPLEKAMTSFPRSPYPTLAEGAEEAVNNRGRQLPRTAANQTRARPRDDSLQSRVNKRNKHGLTLNRPIGVSNFSPVPSPLSQSFVSSTAQLHTSSLNRANKPAPLALESDGSAGSDQLSNAFWNSVSIESANEPMVTALEYPESAIEYEEKIDIGMRSASQPALMFADTDGMLFSPGLPKPHARVGKLRESFQQLMSPTAKRSPFVAIARKEITAPSPNDPFAAFPSFGAVLEKAALESPIRYPPPVAYMT
jgi:hypothetical protein